jgi:hypothetical protein
MWNPPDGDWTADPMFDSAIIAHGFAAHMRDYDVIADIPAAQPGHRTSYIAARLRYRFTHCVSAHCESKVTPETWSASWGDEFIEYDAWLDAREPSGFVWGVNSSGAYPGPDWIDGSSAAAEWSERLGRPMREFELVTEAFHLRLVFHDVRVTTLAEGDPETGTLTELPE